MRKTVSEHAKGRTSLKRSDTERAKSLSRRGRGGESRKASSWRTCSAPPAGEDVHRLGGVEGNSNDDALRVIDKGQGDGVKKLAGWTTTTTTRSWLDGAQLDLHWGRRADADGKRGRG